MKRIIFYKEQNDVKEFYGSGTAIMLNSKNIVSLVERFETGEIHTLLAGPSLLHGWRTKLTSNECVVLFVGGGWEPGELRQGVGRVSPIFTSTSMRFPKTKFADPKRGANGQITHIINEGQEVIDAFVIHKDTSEGTDHLLDEINDVAHSIETLIHMIPDEMEASRLRVIEKNRVRGYYPGDDVTYSFTGLCTDEFKMHTHLSDGSLCICGHPKIDHNFGLKGCLIAGCACDEFSLSSRPEEPKPDTTAYMTATEVKGEFPPIMTCVPDGYAPLSRVLVDALKQSSLGKGTDRHATGQPFIEQPIMTIGKRHPGFCSGQAEKKIDEASRMDKGPAERELLGAIVYIAAEILRLRGE